MNDFEMHHPPSNGSKSPLLLTKTGPSKENYDAENTSKCGELHTTNDASSSFERHDLHTMNEPPNRRTRVNDDKDEADDDDDDVDDDGGYGDIDALKVEQMLSRYLDVEDDMEILSALRGGPSAGNNDSSKGGGGEQLAPLEERAFLSFTRRLKRAPGQMARYAYGGVPMWLVPSSPSCDAPVERWQKQRKHPKSKNIHPQKIHSSSLPAVPDCVCGAERVFEFQILPSLLHVLDVDGHAAKDDDDDIMDLIHSGGQNPGSIAVYSCTQSCDESREEFIIVQEAIGDAPIQKYTEKRDDSSDGDD